MLSEFVSLVIAAMPKNIPRQVYFVSGTVTDVGNHPAPGYSACPEHSEKATLFAWLGSTDAIGTQLTSSFAKWPPSSVSGFYYSHPQSEYFNVGKIAQDQLQDYAARKGWTLDEAKRWLAPNLDDSVG